MKRDIEYKITEKSLRKIAQETKEDMYKAINNWIKELKEKIKTDKHIFELNCDIDACLDVPRILEIIDEMSPIKSEDNNDNI